MLGHRTNLRNFKKIKIISNIFSDHNDTKLEVNYKRKLEISQIRGYENILSEQPIG